MTLAQLVLTNHSSPPHPLRYHCQLPLHPTHHQINDHSHHHCCYDLHHFILTIIITTISLPLPSPTPGPLLGIGIAPIPIIGCVVQLG